MTRSPPGHGRALRRTGARPGPAAGRPLRLCMAPALAVPPAAVQFRNYAEGPLLTATPGRRDFWLVEVDGEHVVTSRRGQLVPGLGATPAARLHSLLANPHAGSRYVIGQAASAAEGRALALRHSQVMALLGGVFLWPLATGQPDPPDAAPAAPATCYTGPPPGGRQWF